MYMFSKDVSGIILYKIVASRSLNKLDQMDKKEKKREETGWNQEGFQNSRSK